MPACVCVCEPPAAAAATNTVEFAVAAIDCAALNCRRGTTTTLKGTSLLTTTTT